MTPTAAVRWRSEGQQQQPQTSTLDLSGDCRILANGRAEEKKSEKQRRLTGCGEETAEVRNEKNEAAKTDNKRENPSGCRDKQESHETPGFTDLSALPTEAAACSA